MTKKSRKLPSLVSEIAGDIAREHNTPIRKAKASDEVLSVHAYLESVFHDGVLEDLAGYDDQFREGMSDLSVNTVCGAHCIRMINSCVSHLGNCVDGHHQDVRRPIIQGTIVAMAICLFG